MTFCQMSKIFLKHNPKIKILKLSTKYQVILDKIAPTKTFLQLQLFSQIQTGYHFFFMQSNLHYWCRDCSPNDNFAIKNHSNKCSNNVIQNLSQILAYQITVTKMAFKRI
jgi:hypothetical protein